MIENKKIKVLIVDDSSFIRKYLTDLINSDQELEVIDTASSGEEALLKIKKYKPDVVTLDVLMPGMDGIKTLQEIMKQNPTRVIMVSSATKEGDFATLLSLEIGAIDFVGKPSASIQDINRVKKLIIEKIKSAMYVNINVIAKKQQKQLDNDLETSKKNKNISVKALTEKIQAYKKAREKKNMNNKNSIAHKIVAIGTSMGGPNALKEIFANLNIDTSIAYVIVQHMPKPFTCLFAERLDSASKINFKEAQDGDVLYAGTGYIAPGDAHILIVNKGGIPIIKLSRHGRVSGHMPSIDVMFESLSQQLAKRTVAVIMTGMGRDGADGIKKLKMKGGYTIAQDKTTSVVFGMNGEAIKLGCIDKILPLGEIVDNINGFISHLN